MAEFKLGRIRFVWKGNWAASTTYYKDDIVRSGGNTYVCIAGHTSTTTFANDYSNYWNNLSDGQEWKGDWSPSTYYKVNDIVKYGGYLYIANTGHTSAATIEEGLEGLGSTTPGVRDDIAKWDIYGEGFDYKTTWGANVRYKINDIVRYNSTLYICTEDHISAASETLGIEVDQGKWDVFTKGLDWLGEWSTGYRYRVNDVVKYGGQVYVCNEGHVSAATASDGLEVDQGKWDYFHKGIEYKGTYASGTRYKNNDIVKWGGGIWICTQYHTATDSFNESNWEQFVEGLEFEDSWSSTTNYQHGDIVAYGGYVYVAVTSNNIGLKPNENTDDWDLVTTGFNFRGLYGDDSTNQHYTVGDVVTLGGYTYLCIADHETAQRPPNGTYWERLNSGLYWKDAWTDATLYDTGDVVRYTDSSYVCILTHTSDEVGAKNGPHQPAGSGGSGDTYWDLIASGPENSVLTTDGDLIYYSGVGPARLPIGEPGQVLRVNDAGTAPEWGFLGSINNVYYVETNNGVDSPAPVYGITLDKPWKTVRYAAEQVDQGPLRYNAKKLLEANRSFIQAEVVEYIDNTYPGLSYTKETCRRDIGQIVDALVWDLSHGGNEKSRAAAISYFDTDGVTYLADNATETADAIDYLVTLVNSAVLRSLAPATNYQTLNGVGSPITQQIIGTYYRGVQDSDGAEALVVELAGIISSAITAGSIAGVPTEIKPQNTIFVKTGEFAEILPIIIPENTAVVGDELRSTRIAASGSVRDIADTTHVMQILTDLKSIIGDVITNTPITPTTTGAVPNTETQVTTRPAGSTGTIGNVTAIQALADEIYDIVDNGVGNANSLVFTDTGAALKTTARTELQTNRATIISDLITWIDANYPNLGYNQTKCERDTGYLIDALSYDIQYGSTWATNIFARNYLDLDGTIILTGANNTGAFPNTYNLGTEYTEVSARTATTLQLVVASDTERNKLLGLPEETAFQINHEALGTWTANLVSSELQEDDSVLLTFTNTSNDLDDGNDTPGITFISFYDGTNAPTIAAYNQLKTIIDTYMSGATEVTQAEGLIDIVNDVLTNGSSAVPAISYPSINWVSQTLQDAHATIIASRSKLASDTKEYVKANYGFSFNEEVCERDAGYMIDALAYDMALGSNYQSVTAGLSYYKVTTSAQTVLTDQKDGELDSILYLKNTLKFYAANGASIKGELIVDDLVQWINSIERPISGSNDPATDTGTTYAVEVLEANREFLKAEVIAKFEDTPSSGSLDLDVLDKDLNRWIDAIKYDLIYTGNYKSTFEGRYYTNSVTGSKLEDMFYARNGTGLRNCTVIGLDGSSDGDSTSDIIPQLLVTGVEYKITTVGDTDWTAVGAANTNLGTVFVATGTAVGTGRATKTGLYNGSIYDTLRPLAGSYTSLDPGWGPNDNRAWIRNKSPYVQNVTTFGTGCVGCKIDGDLHAGGNDSIVSNDFTQVLSDGIGVWCTNLARTELVSVFSYYGHIGYLAENGGKIRATNGNSSYGDYGTVAEGIDPTEVPISGNVTNRWFQAVVGRVFTDGSRILTLEYLNAGNDYTSGGTDITLQTDGFFTVIGQDVDTVQTKNNSVFEVRLLDTDTTGDGESDFGGDGYKNTENVAQEGTDTQIVLSNTDVSLSQQYFGMAIYLTSGLGAGQYGFISTYNDGTKIAKVLKQSTSLAVTATAATTNIITIENTANLVLDEEIVFVGPDMGGISAGTSYYVKTIDSGTEITISATPGGAVKTLTTATGNMLAGKPGWDSLIGDPIEPLLDSTTGYSIEPYVRFDTPNPGTTGYAETAKARAVVEDEKITSILIYDPGEQYFTVPTMTIWDPNNTVDVPHEVRIGSGVLAQPTWLDRGQAIESAVAFVDGDGFMDRFQPGPKMRVINMTDIPQPGANIEFGNAPGVYYKLVTVRDVTGSPGTYSMELQVAPDTTIAAAPGHLESVELRIRYSQVRLTGHDFLDIGTGNFTETNYPNDPLVDPDPEKETFQFGGGRVFYTSTDQDGNFRVGELFSVEQSTGVATLNADAFNLSGLQELSLGEIGLGSTGATISEFSTDGTFTANSDNIVPTQKAIRTYITSQIGGGAATLNVNSITAGQVQISGQEITTTTGNQIRVLRKMNFTEGVDGVPVAMNYFLTQ